jgi:protein involved in polysaccharide export with SLBB domain
MKMARLLFVPLLLAVAPTHATSAGNQSLPPEAVTAAAEAYQLGTDDKLRITVFGEDRLTGEYAVTGAGELSFPLIGNIPAAGKSVEDVRETIRSRLANGYLKDPRVSVEVLNYRPFYILGEVTKPGQYPYVIGMTVQQAVATAGGYTYRANTRRVFIKRTLSTSEKQFNLRRDVPIAIQPGDTIRVSERFF